jgi:hypothetical protein
LLIPLSEAQEEIVEAISKLPTIIRFLFGLLSIDFVPVIVHEEALSCLTSLTEDNTTLCEQITENSKWIDGLVQTGKSNSLKGVAACGVLHNIFSALQWFDHNAPNEGVSDAMLIPNLVQSMEKASTHGNGINGHSTNSSPDQVLQLALEITASIASSLQEAMEHGTRSEKKSNVHVDTDEAIMDADKMDADEDDIDEEKDGDDDDGPDGGEPEEDDEINDDEIEADMDLVIGDGPDDENLLQEGTLDRLVRLAAPKVLVFALPITESSVVQTYALSALSNIAWIVSSIDFSDGHLDSLSKFWSSVAQQSWNEIIRPVLASNTADIELASAITSLAWAICRSAPGVIVINSEEQRKFMALYQASRSLPAGEQTSNKKGYDYEGTDAFQSLGVKSIGVLGRLALHPAPVNLNKEIGVFLLTVLSDIPATPVADAIEALNQIFDIYADKSYAFDEAVFWTHGFYKHLEEILPKAKKMAKVIDKRHYAELRDRADEAVLNLGRFLKYKRSEKTQKN